MARFALCSITLAAVLGVVLCGCGSSPHFYRVSGDSMSPLIRSGDRAFVDESSSARTDLHDGDVIALQREDAVVLKRILAMPGETIVGQDRKVFRNGKLVDEPYLAPASGEGESWMPTFSARKVPSDELFVLGDNRDRSLDSRAVDYAPVKLSDVLGKYRWTYWQAPPAAK